nr:MAG TPA: hypothetical protein [Caudoviricetes sp.]
MRHFTENLVIAGFERVFYKIGVALSAAMLSAALSAAS